MVLSMAKRKGLINFDKRRNRVVISLLVEDPGLKSKVKFDWVIFLNFNI